MTKTQLDSRFSIRPDRIRMDVARRAPFDKRIYRRAAVRCCARHSEGCRRSVERFRGSDGTPRQGEEREEPPKRRACEVDSTV